MQDVQKISAHPVIMFTLSALYRMFGMVVESLYLQDLQKVSGHVERKICAVGVTSILTEAPAMLQAYQSFWCVYLRCK